MGTTDRAIRLTIAALAIILYFAGVVTGGLGIALLVVAGIFTLTSFISFCPIYAIFGVKTCKVSG